MSTSEINPQSRVKGGSESEQDRVGDVEKRKDDGNAKEGSESSVSCCSTNPLAEDIKKFTTYGSGLKSFANKNTDCAAIERMMTTSGTMVRNSMVGGFSTIYMLNYGALKRIKAVDILRRDREFQYIYTLHLIYEVKVNMFLSMALTSPKLTMNRSRVDYIESCSGIDSALDGGNSDGKREVSSNDDGLEQEESDADGQNRQSSRAVQLLQCEGFGLTGTLAIFRPKSLSCLKKSGVFMLLEDTFPCNLYRLSIVTDKQWIGQLKKTYTYLQVRKMAFDMICALSTFHALGFAHFDLKPGNILIDFVKLNRIISYENARFQRTSRVENDRRIREDYMRASGRRESTVSHIVSGTDGCHVNSSSARMHTEADTPNASLPKARQPDFAMNQFACSICDFGLSMPSDYDGGVYLNKYLCTRNYRAPEIVTAIITENECSKALYRPGPRYRYAEEVARLREQLKHLKFGQKSDIWSLGVIIAELSLGVLELFPLGRRTREGWSQSQIESLADRHSEYFQDREAYMERRQRMHYMESKHVNSKGLLAFDGLRELVLSMTESDPSKRPTAHELLNSPAFACERYNRELSYKSCGFDGPYMWQDGYVDELKSIPTFESTFPEWRRNYIPSSIFDGDRYDVRGLWRHLFGVLTLSNFKIHK